VAIGVRVAAALAALAYGFGALSVADRTGEFTTYIGSFPQAGALVLAAGLALVIAGLAASLLRVAGGLGDLAVAGGYLWFYPLWVGWEGGPPLVRSLAMVAQGLAVPVLVHIVSRYPVNRRASHAIRVVVILLYVDAVVSAVFLALFRDPFLDPFCWSNCRDNVFLVASYPELTGAVQGIDLVVTGLGVALFAALLLGRLLRASRPARRALWPVLPGAVLLAAATVGHGRALLRTPLETPASSDFRLAFVGLCLAILLIAVALPLPALRIHVQRRAIAQIVADIGGAPATGSLRAALRRALADPSLDIAYWLPSSRHYVDALGRSVVKSNGSSGRVVTRVVRDGQPVAMVTHAAGGPDVAAHVGAAVRLALDNERLRAETLAALVDLRASRKRIVEAGDLYRQRLERDLHDGAQQDLLALLFDIRRARTAAAGSAVASLADAERAVQASIDELREIAHGIYPAVLTQVGLASALTSLAEGARIPVEIEPVAERRYASNVEVTAYLVVADAIGDAAQRAASFASVRISGDDRRLVIEVHDDGRARTATLTQLEDRVGALGGLMEGGEGWLRAEVPCG
jgi:signal transduction histidine kinase